MKNKYAAYYRPDSATLKTAAESALFVFDANCLLDVLRFSPKLADKALKAFEKYKDRIRIPAQADFEYHKHLCEVPAQALVAVENAKNKLTPENLSILDNTLRDLFKSGAGCEFPKDCLNEYSGKLKTIFDEIRASVETLRRHFEDNFRSRKLQSRLSDILSGSMLQGLTPEKEH